MNQYTVMCIRAIMLNMRRLRFSSMKPNEVLSTLERLILQGKYDKALASIEELENTVDLSGEDRVRSWIVRLQIKIQKGEYEEAYLLTEKYLILNAQFNNPLLTLDILFQRSHILLLLGKAADSFQILVDCEGIIENLESNSPAVKKRKAHLFFRKGQHFVNENKLSESLKYIQKSITIAEEIDNKREKAFSQFILASILWLQGELDNAIEIYHQVIAIAEQFHAKYYIANCLVNIGEIHYWKGNYDDALGYYRKALIHYEFVDGEHSVGFVATLFLMITVLINNNALEDAKSHLNRMLQLEKESNNRMISQYSQLAKGLILKQSPRIKEKVKAQELLKNLLADENLFFELKVTAMLSYCETLIEELKLYGAPEVLYQIKSLMAELHENAHKEQNPLLMVQSLLLQAKLLLVEGNLQETEKLLLQAKEKATEIGLTQLENEITREIQNFHDEINKWTVLMKQASLIERLEEVQIKEYIQDAQKIIHSHR